MSVFLTILRSEWDALLPWPFSCPVTFTLMEQKVEATARLNVTQTVKPNTCKENRPFLGRPVGERNPSFGVQKFIAIKDIEVGDYVKDDVIFIKIDIDTRDMPHL